MCWAGLPEDSGAATMCVTWVVKTVGAARLLLKAQTCVPGACQWLGLGQSEPVVGMMLTILQRRQQHVEAQPRVDIKTFTHDNAQTQNEAKIKEKTYTQADMDADLKNKRMGSIVTALDPEELPHFKKHSTPNAAIQGADDVPPAATHTLPHRIWTDEEIYSIQITHKTPEGFVDKAAYNTIQFIRKSFDYVTGFNTEIRTEASWVKRIIFLETVAGVPGMIAAMTRHLHSLRRMRRDYGWIHTLLEEAENERMHLITALHLQKPSILTRLGVIGAQGLFVTGYGVAYLLSPRFCHRLVGYLEEEAVKTYTKCIQDIDKGTMKIWQTKPAPDVAIRYWQLDTDATMRDVILAIRADEAQHRLVNHTFASMRKDQWNPYRPGE